MIIYRKFILQDPFAKVPDEEPTPSLSELRERSRLRREKTVAVAGGVGGGGVVNDFNLNFLGEIGAKWAGF